MAQKKQASQGKQSKSLNELRNPTQPKSTGGIVPEKARTPLAIAVIFISLLIFFNGVLGSDKAFKAEDNVASESILPYLKAAQSAGRSVPQWIPNIFCGMPSFASLLSTGARTYDLGHQLFDGLRTVVVSVFGGNDAMIHIWHYFIFGLGMYLLMRMTRKTSHLVALFAAFSAMFSTWIMTYVMIGHNTKVFAVMCFPYILLCLEKLREEKQPWQKMLLWVSALAISLHFLLESSHVQMAFYQLLAILIYFLTWLFADLFSKRNIVPLLRTGIISLIMVGAAFAMSADRYMATLGYDSYSIRGAAPLVDRSAVTGEKKTSGSAGVSKSGGLDWNYATEYSFSPAEMITFLVPGWYGFGKLPYDGPEVPAGARVPGYWGQATTTDAANYTGIVVFFLALIAIFGLWKKDRLVPPLAIISGVAILLSFGSTMSLLYKPMFEYFPTFNKFRAPMMALVLMQLSFPILAALALDRIIRVMKSSDDKALKARLTKLTTYAMYLATAFLVLSIVGGGAIESSITSGITAAAQKPAAQYPFLKDLAIKTALTDARLCSLFALIALAMLWLYLKGKGVTATLVTSVVVIISSVDLIRLASRPLEITTRTDYDQNLKTHDYVDFIKQDKSLSRVLDLNESTSNIPVAWGLQTIAGYHAAKMRVFQDVVDVTGNKQGQVIWNPFMWNLLNTKYVIANGGVDTVQGRMVPAFISREQSQGQDGKPTQTIVWQNTQVLPRAYFVNRYDVKQPLEILHAMRDGSFNPRDVLFFDKQPEGLGTLASTPVNDSTETVTITKYENEAIEIKTKAATDRLIFMSDTWYPDWKAELDDKTPLTIYKANYAFRAMKVPAGEHTIHMLYYDDRYATGKTVSLATNILALLGLGFGLVFEFKKKKPDENSSEEKS